MIVADVTNYIKFSGDQTSELTFNSGELEDSPKLQQLITLAAGDNAIAVPSITGFVVHGVVIVPPSLNAIELVLKGIGADMGIALNAIHASVIHFGTPPGTFVIFANLEVVGLRLVWF